MLVITVADVLGGIMILVLGGISLYAYIQDRRRKARERKELF